MAIKRSTYDIAAFIHDSVWQRNSLLNDELLASSRLRKMLGHVANTEQVLGLGLKNPALPAHETLTKGRNGLYYFQATAGHEYTGELSMGRYVITPADNPEIAQRFASSLIVNEFIKITEHLI